MMFRKVLDRATRELFPQGAKVSPNLSKRIEELAKQNRITEAVRDWADVIRLDGNEAVHDEDPDENLRSRYSSSPSCSCSTASGCRKESIRTTIRRVRTGTPEVVLERSGVPLGHGSRRLPAT